MKIEAYHEHPFGKLRFPIDCHAHTKAFTFPLHFHQEVEMIYVEKGSVSISVLQKDFTITEGQLVIVGCNHIHSYNHVVEVEESVFHVLIFDWKFFKNFADDEEIEKLLYPVFFDVTIVDSNNIPGIKNLYKLFRKLSQSNLKTEIGNKFNILGYLYEIVGDLISYGNFNSDYKYSMKQMEKEHELLSKVNNYIFKHYKSGITLTSVSKAIGYSEFHFARQFKSFTGITFKQYLTHYQILMAKEDVLADEMAITEIAFKHGFNSVKTFNRLFKSYFGVAPTVYRKETLK
jgi:AraC-like DNA-binding protein